MLTLSQLRNLKLFAKPVNGRRVSAYDLVASFQSGTGDDVPAQTSNSGKFLTTNGTAMSWSAISQVPTQTGNSGKFLTTNGTAASWAAVPAPIAMNTWNTAGRPGSPVAGEFGFNTQTSSLDIYTGSGWVAVALS